MVEKGIRNEICHYINRYPKANNKYINNYDKKKNTFNILNIGM